MSERVHYRGRLEQIRIYLGKQLRMFVYQNDWKVLPMAALIAGLVTFAVGKNLFKTQEGTLSGCFALVCVCIWNGCFNSIQVVCRERPIIKREHRSGMHVFSYVTAHMIYQAMLCVMQTIILIIICSITGIAFPKTGLVTGNFMIDMGISMFLITYAADMMALMISSLVKDTTTAMTVMPFVMIFQLIFSGGLIPLEGAAKKLSSLTLAKWGLQNLCALGRYNEQPMVTLWNTIWKFRSMVIDGEKPVEMITNYILDNNLLDHVLQESGRYNLNILYEMNSANVMQCWIILICFALVFAFLAMALLKRIDKDRR